MKPTLEAAGEPPGKPDQLQRLFDAALDSVIGMSGEGLVTAWNSRAVETFGWSRAEAIGRPLAELIIPERLRAAHWSGLQHYRKTGTGPVINRRVEVAAIRRDGSEFPVELTVIPLADVAGESFYAFLRDISDRKEADRVAQQRALEAHVLYEAALLVAQGGSVATLLGGCLAKICQVTRWTVGHVYFPDDPLNPSHLVPSDIWHIADPGLEGLPAAAKGFRMARGEGLPGRIWASGEPEWTVDLSQATDFPRRDMLIGYGLKSAFGFPVLLQGRLQAVLEFFSPASERPDDTLMLVAHSLAEQLGRVLERQRALDHQNMLASELDHRVGNSLAVIASVFRRTAERATSVADLQQKFEARLQGLAGAHELLAHGAWKSASVEQVAATMLATVSDTAAVRISGPEVRLPGPQVLTLAMALQELALNAVSHGALASESGRLAIAWRVVTASDGMRIVLDWRETGGPPVREPPQLGYGLTLVERLIKDGLNGAFEAAFEPAGLHAVIEVGLGGELAGAATGP